MTLARAHVVGYRVDRSIPAAQALFEAACGRGDAAACLGLADLMESGAIPAAPARSAALVLTACSRGDAEACARLDQRGAPRRALSEARTAGPACLGPDRALQAVSLPSAWSFFSSARRR